MKLEQLLEKLHVISRALKKPISELSMRDCTQNGVSERQLRNFGGLPKIKKAHFPNQNKDLAEVLSLSQQASYITKLEKQLAERKLTEELILSSLEKFVTPVELPKVGAYKPKKGGLEREVVVSLNDCHYGLIVDPQEVNDSNKFGWQEACRRTALLAQQVADYKIEKRDQVKRLHVILNGDIVQGKIHDLTALTSDLLVMQQIGAAHILTHFIGHVAQHYPEVVVHGISGNHDDNLHRREGGRVTSHKYDSVLNPVFYAVSLAFRNNKNVRFNLPKGLHLDIDLPGGRLVATHGDTLFSKQLGNPGTNLNIKGLSDVLNRWNQAELSKGKPQAKAFLFGHVHNFVHFKTFDGVQVYIAPSLSGIDGYAHSLAISHNNTGQVIFESTKNHIIGDPRLVEMTCADNNKELDKIIPTFNRLLAWEK